MINIYQNIRRAVFEYRRIKASWKENCKRAYEMEDVLKSRDNQDVKRIEFTFKKLRHG